MAKSLEDFAGSLPEGPFWITGEFVRELVDVLIADRARADGTTVSELPSPKGRFFSAPGGGGGGTPPLLPLTILDASAGSNGTSYPGRIRVVNGLLGGLLPDEMTVPDIVLPDKTDNHCYLTVTSGTSYVYGKVLVDSDTGLYTSADVYVVSSPEDPDGTYAYLQIGVVTWNGSGPVTADDIQQNVTGSQSLLVFASADGSQLQAAWST